MQRERTSNNVTENTIVTTSQVGDQLQGNQSDLGNTIVTSNEEEVFDEENGNANEVREINNNVNDDSVDNSRNEHSNNNVNNYTTDTSCRSYNILLIGLSYNSYVLNQLKNDIDVINISQCKDENGRIIDQCVARDTYRSYILEKTYPFAKVFTVNKCTDAVRSCDNENDPYNINCDVGTNQFLKLVSKKSWKFNEIYVDTIRMQKIYVEHNFSKKFQ